MTRQCFLAAFVTTALLTAASPVLSQERLVQIFVVRHPETEGAPADPRAIHLSVAGRERAALLVPTLAGTRISHLFASHTVRTRETLEELARSRCLSNACFPPVFNRLWYVAIHAGTPGPVVFAELRYGAGWSPQGQ